MTFPTPENNILADAISIAAEATAIQLELMGHETNVQSIIHDHSKIVEDGTVAGRWSFEVHLTSPDHHSLVTGVWYDGYDNPSQMALDIVPSF